MKHRYSTAVLILLTFSLSCYAQVLKGSYFLDNSIDRNKMNPAFAPESGYLQLPAIGNTSVGLYSNWLGIGTMLYPLNNGKLGTFLHPDVSVEQFERQLPVNPHLDFASDINLLGFGWNGRNGAFWTFDMGVKANVDTDIPRDLFLFLKKGTGLDNQSFNIGNINVSGNVSVQAAIGHSRQITDNLRVGGKLRFIAPVGYAGLNLRDVRLTTGQDKWQFDIDGDLNVAMQGLNLQIQEITPDTQDFEMPQIDFDVNRMLENKILAGMGFSLDLGVEYVLNTGGFLDGLSLSAAVTDLGMIRYKDSAVSSYTTKGSFTFEGIKDISTETDFNKVLEQLKNDALGGLMHLEETDAAALSRSTGPGVYAGVELPFLRRSMSVGLLYSARMSQTYARHELTASYNLKPSSWFALGANYSFLNSAKNLGFILELTPRVGPAIRVGTDYLFLEYAKAPILSEAGVPEQFALLPTGNMMFNLNFALAFNLGGKKK